MFTNATSARGTFFDLFSIDVRSLAALRMGLALVSLYYVTELFPDSKLFLTQKGFLPVELSRQLLNEAPNGYWSFYWLADSVSSCKMLLGFHLLFAVGLLIGFQTRVMTIACVLFTWSLEVRNPLLQEQGLSLLRLLLLWSVFLPVGKIWSVDSRLQGSSLDKKMNWQIANVATFALIFQSLACLLLFTISLWLGKSSVSDWFLRDINLNFLGTRLADDPRLTNGLGYLAIVLLTLVPASMFVPRYSEFFRGTGLAVFWLAQLTILMLFQVGIYPLVAIVSWLVFIPGHAWNDFFGEPVSFETRAKPPRPGLRTFLVLQLPGWTCASLLLLVLLTSLMHWHLISFDKLTNQRVSQLSQLTMTSPGWTSDPVSTRSHQEVTRPWFAYPGQLRDGRYVDLLNQNHLDVGEKPSVVADSFPNERWRRFHLNLWKMGPPENIRQQIAATLLNHAVNKWNACPMDNLGPIVNARLICVEEVYRRGRVDKIHKQTWSEL